MKETFSNLKKVYYYGRRYKKNLIIFFLISVVFIFVNIVIPVLSAKQLVYLSDSLYEELLWASVLVFGISFVSSILHWVLRRNTQIFFRGTIKNIQLATSKEILKIEVSDIDKKTSGTFIQRISNDANEMGVIFTQGMGHLTNILTDIGVFIAVLVIDVRIFIFFFISSIILTILYLIKVKKVDIEDKKFRVQRDKTSGLIGELVRGVRDIKMLHAKKSFINELEDNIDKLTVAQFNMRNKDMNYNCSIDTTRAAINLILILFLIYYMYSGSMTIATALVLYNYKDKVLGNLIVVFGNLLTQVKSFNLSCERVFGVLGNKEFSKEVFGEEHIKDVKGNFEFKDVYFGYGDNQVLKGMNFKIKENETVAFVGKSGAGKTTIFSLLCKLYDVDSGTILIDGKDIKDLDEYSIRNNITIISQNPYIFNMSIRDNLRLVKEKLTEEEMIEACKMACLHDFIMELPEGYDTVVGEGGVNLSGGQRQRLAIARAFVQKTKIILFDEATSALDNETQELIQQAINNMKDKYTILIIAHRLSTIINSDRIMLIEDGKVTAKGTHKELLKNNKSYKKLYNKELIDKDN